MAPARRQASPPLLKLIKLNQKLSIGCSFVKGLAEGDARKAQLGLAHSYSRAKVKFNVNKADNMIIQARCV